MTSVAGVFERNSYLWWEAPCVRPLWVILFFAADILLHRLQIISHHAICRLIVITNLKYLRKFQVSFVGLPNGSVDLTLWWVTRHHASLCFFADICFYQSQIFFSQTASGQFKYAWDSGYEKHYDMGWVSEGFVLVMLNQNLRELNI